MKENIKESAQAEFKKYIVERGKNSDHDIVVWQHEITFMDAVNWTLKHLIGKPLSYFDFDKVTEGITEQEKIQESQN